MPVSTGPHPRRRGSLHASWNSTRERIDADTRRRTLNVMQELGGTELHDRPDWPLPSPPPGAREDRVKGAVLRTDPVELEDDHTDDSAVMGRPKEIAGQGEGMGYLGESDVSDLEEEEEDIQYAYGDGAAEGSSTASSSPHIHAQTDYSMRSESYRAPHRNIRHETQAEVSPVRDEEHPRSRTRTQSDGDVLREVPRLTPAQQLVQSIINGEAEELNTTREDVDEGGDIATPITFGANSPGLTQGWHPGGSPHLNGDIIPTLFSNASNPRSSIVKGPMTTPSHRRVSQRSSWINTTQIPSHKNNVRYSWQSIQDDEPNRPRIHIIKLISNTATASAGFPTGEAFGFSISPGGKKIAAFNSARLFVLQTNALPVGISQDYALKRRPLAVELTDEGNTMAILADGHTVNIYDLGLQLKRARTIKLDFPSTCIALAATGGLLAAAYEGGCEIFSLSVDALPTDRRAVRSLKMDRMAFSEDGSTLVGTTTRINVSSTVVVQVPVFPSSPDNVATHEELKEAWCSELLHPEIIRNSSHATFMRESRKTCNERLFAWNGVEDTFGILNVGDMQYGKIDFPVVISPPLSTCGGLGAAIHSCPAIDEHGDTVAMIVNDRTIRLYIVPPKIEDEAVSVEAHSIDHELDEGYGCPFSEVRWVYGSTSLPAPSSNRSPVKGRLIVTSPGGVTDSGISEESVEDIEGGRIILFDFDPQFTGQPGQTFSLTLGKSPPMTLEEEEVNLQEQVSLVRRRTVNQSKSGGLHARPNTLGRSATTYGGRGGYRGPSPAFSNAGSNRNRASMLSIGSMQSDATRSLPDLMEGGEEVDAFEEPYAQGAPRSHASLLRAASNAQRHRFQTIEERNQVRASIDSSGGFLPLPEYTEEANAPLPNRFRAMAGLDQPAQFNPSKPAVAVNTDAATASSSFSSNPRTAPPDNALRMHRERAPTAAPSRTGTYDAMDIVRGTMSSAASSRAYSPSGSASGIGTNNSFAPPPGAAGTFDSFAAMPRSLQRAYSNAVSPMGTGAPPSLIGDWRNVSPAMSYSGTLVNGRIPVSPASTVAPAQDEAWDVISPVTVNGQASNSYRHSTARLNSPPGSASSFATQGVATSAPSSPAGVRLPPHMQAFRTAAAANTSASLFPPTQPHDHVPVRPNTTRAGTAAHPVTAWHPPAASTPNIAISRTSGSMRGHHSRKSSLAGRSAFANTQKAKKLGFFRRNRKVDPYALTAAHDDQMRGGGSVIETKSMVTWITRRDKSCTVM
ncbi:hypothetical protein DOTSEDRAFT_169794 [Dothistroma septosporum NZE10]|uniref:DUF7165 domain-containing protein n=1 Tax=Dothistroma septosporum (strain NZE10 / CBS 128990) TaxID=675120 RepID=N1PXH1_DOTSN|nr:hypothetical protein DOTSEDRAFT_169794 [Dothistroma septosporum NZE10]